MFRIILMGFFALSFLYISTPVQAGGWTQPRGHGFYKLSEQLVRATSFYELNGNQLAIPTLSTYTTSVYGEYGLTDRLTLICYMPFVQRITLNKQVGSVNNFVFFPGDAKTGIADSDVGVRIGLLSAGRTVLSTQIMFGLPLGDDRQIMDYTPGMENLISRSHCK